MSATPTDHRPETRGPWHKAKSVLRPGPAARYVNPKAEGLVNEDGDHDANLDVAEESSPNYLRWIADRCRPHLGKRVLEVGAGTGSITGLYAPGRDVLAIDRSPWCVDEMEKRFASVDNVEVRKVDLLELVDEGQRFDSVVMLNVLEHIEDDVAVLRMLGSLLEPDGRVVLYVPALNGLYGKWDRKVGHYRRYAPWRLRAVLDEAGYGAGRDGLHERAVDAGLVGLLALRRREEHSGQHVTVGQDGHRVGPAHRVGRSRPVRSQPLLRGPPRRTEPRRSHRRSVMIPPSAHNPRTRNPTRNEQPGSR